MITNIKKLYLVQFLSGMVFWYATEKLFMQFIGINSFGVAVNAAVLLAVIVLFDVPSGILADKWKRKYVLLLAVAALFVSTLVLGVSNGLPMYLIGSVIYGAYLVLSSGTFQATMYDSLLESGKQHEYSKYQGRAYGLFMVGMALSSLLGGYIAEYVGLRETFLWSLPLAALAAAVLLFVKEPPVHKELSDAKLLAHVRRSWQLIISQPIVLHLALFLVIGGMLRSTQNEFAGLYYIGIGLTAVLMGYVNAGKWIAGALGNVLAPALGRARAFKLLPWFFVAFALFSVIADAPGIIFFLLAATLYAIVANQAEAALQDHVPSHVRATTLALISFAINVIMIPLSLVFGLLAERASVFHGYAVFALIGLAYTIFWLFVSRRRVTVAR